MSAPAPAAPEPLLPHSRAARRPSNTPTLWRFLRRSSALPLSLLASCVHPGSAFVPGGTDDEDDEDDDYDGLWDDTLPAAGITVGFATNFILNPPYPQYAPGGSLQPLLKSDAPTRSKTRLLKPPPLALGPVLGAAPIVARIFTHLPASSVQRLSRVCRMWRQCADCALQKFSVSLCVSWMQGKGASSMHEWSGRLIVENEYCVDDFRSSSLRILQLREWTFGTSSENFMNRNFVEIRNTRKHVAIPVHQIERIRIEFSDSAGISYSRATHYFETASQHPFSNGRAELFAQNCSIVLSPSGNSVERVRVGIASAASTAAENSHHFVSRIRASPTMYSRRRWSELVEYECEARAAFGAGSEFAADVLQAVFETCAMRNYLSCPEHERVLSEFHILVFLIAEC
ncbi:hypothetical protein HDU82_000393 [Entophlyctis luteolus]|nr:hypothetical protein HDU82_000393 [Entophlyctis luteolus]